MSQNQTINHLQARAEFTLFQYSHDCRAYILFPRLIFKVKLGVFFTMLNLLGGRHVRSQSVVLPCIHRCSDSTEQVEFPLAWVKRALESEYERMQYILF